MITEERLRKIEQDNNKYVGLAHKQGKELIDEVRRLQKELEQVPEVREMLRELVENPPMGNCEIRCIDYCALCGSSKGDMEDIPIDHADDCLITRARAIVEGE